MSYPPNNLDWDRLKADIRRAADCVELYPRLHPDPAGNVRDGGTVRCIAPDHADSDPSMSLHEDGFKCHACGASGDVFTMWALVYGRSTEGEDFKQTVVELADHYNLNLEDYTRNGQSVDADPEGTWSPPEPGEGWAHESGTNRRGGTASDGERPNDNGPAPLEARRKLFGRLWSNGRPGAPPSDWPPAAQWLRIRHIPPDVADAYGCADWSRLLASGDIQKQLRRFGKEHGARSLYAAGMINDDGDPWWPLRTYQQGTGDERGLVVPVWHPDHPEAPIAVRWRTYSVDAYRKAYQQPCGPGRFRQPPLGLCEPPPEVQLEINEAWVNALPHDQADSVELDGRWRPAGTYPGPYAIVLCEGETDWLSVAAAALELQSETRIVPIGLTTMSAPWNDRWTNLIDGADRIAVAFDRGTGNEPAGEKRTGEIIRALTRRHGERYVRERVAVELRDDDEDLNDLRADSALAGRLRQWLHLEDV